ncbi:MAG: DNA polymerase I, partial [Clostridia bacterium]|nr:DNA polymerase I [Clostridia bacterium]
KAADYIEKYLDRLPGVRDYMEKAKQDGRDRGYAKTLFGRRRELPELKASNFNTRSFGERVAMNMPIQGTAADIIKAAMVKVHRRLRDEGLRAKLVLQIHDELIIDTPEDEAERVSALLSECMTGVIRLDVPLVADVASGHSWFDTK